MKTVKAIIIGGFVWILGSSFYTISYFLPFLENLELQANLTLAIAIIPNAWLGTRLYYKWESNMYGPKLAVIMLVTAIILDAIVTVPLLIIPNGGSYQQFFLAPAFWLILAEYMLVVLAYWNLKVKSLLNQCKFAVKR